MRLALQTQMCTTTGPLAHQERLVTSDHKASMGTRASRARPVHKGPRVIQVSFASHPECSCSLTWVLLGAYNGIDGTPGTPGMDGDNGMDGAPGARGATGAAGLDGSNGTQVCRAVCYATIIVVRQFHIYLMIVCSSFK